MCILRFFPACFKIPLGLHPSDCTFGLSETEGELQLEDEHVGDVDKGEVMFGEAGETGMILEITSFIERGGVGGIRRPPSDILGIAEYEQKYDEFQ